VPATKVEVPATKVHPEIKALRRELYKVLDHLRDRVDDGFLDGMGGMDEWDLLAYSAFGDSRDAFREHLHNVDDHIDDIYQKSKLVPRIVICGRGTDTPKLRKKSKKR